MTEFTKRDLVFGSETCAPGPRAVSKLPLTMMILAPYAMAWASFAHGYFAPGNDHQRGQTAVCTEGRRRCARVSRWRRTLWRGCPSSMALAIAITIPRSLNDPVGLQPSSLKYSSGTAQAQQPAGWTLPAECRPLQCVIIGRSVRSPAASPCRFSVLQLSHITALRKSCSGPSDFRIRWFTS